MCLSVGHSRLQGAQGSALLGNGVPALGMQPGTAGERGPEDSEFPQGSSWAGGSALAHPGWTPSPVWASWTLCSCHTRVRNIYGSEKGVRSGTRPAVPPSLVTQSLLGLSHSRASGLGTEAALAQWQLGTPRSTLATSTPEPGARPALGDGFPSASSWSSSEEQPPVPQAGSVSF